MLRFTGASRWICCALVATFTGLTGLAVTRAAAAEPDFVADFRSPVVKTRVEGIRAAVKSPEQAKAYWPAILELAVNDTVTAVRTRAIEALGDLQIKEALPTLIELNRESSAAIKKSTQEAITAIGQLTPEEEAWLAARNRVAKVRGKYMPLPKFNLRYPSSLGKSFEDVMKDVRKEQPRLNPRTVEMIAVERTLMLPTRDVGAFGTIFAGRIKEVRKGELVIANANETSVTPIIVAGVDTGNHEDGGLLAAPIRVAIIAEETYEDKRAILAIPLEQVIRGITLEEYRELKQKGTLETGK